MAGKPAMANYKGALKRVATAAFIFMLSNPLEFVIKGVVPGADAISDPRTTRVIYSNVWLQNSIKAAILGTLMLIIAFNVKAVRNILLRAPILCLFAIYALCSLRWSDTPSNSITDLTYLLTAICAGASMAVLYDSEDSARVFAEAGLIIAVASVIMALFFPLYGLHQASEGNQAAHVGAWRGVYVHKNILGQVMATFFVIYLFNGRELFRSRLLHLGTAGLALLLVLASRSASGLAIIAISSAVYGFLFILRGFPKLVALAAMPLFLLTISRSAGLLLSALGRDENLSGRTDVWTAAYRVFMDQPWFGYGYGSATLGGLTVYIQTRLAAQNTHNGYIDLALSSGVIGSLLFYGAVGTAIYRAAQAWSRKGGDALFIRVFTIFLVSWAVAAFSETSLRPNTAMGAFGIMAIVLLCCLKPRGQVNRQYQGQRIPTGEAPSGSPQSLIYN